MTVKTAGEIQWIQCFKCNSSFHQTCVSAESTDIFGNWSCSNCSDKTVCQLCYEEDPPEDTCYDEDEDEDEDIDWAQCDNCKHWFHQFCIGCRVDKSMNWICPLCISRKSQIKE